MIPNLLKKIDIPEKIPTKLNDKIVEFSKTKDKKEFLEKSFFYVVNSWGGSRINLIFKFNRLFETDIFKIINTKGYLHCTTMNYIIRIMAIKSNLFKEEDIKTRLTNTWYINIHQYLEIKLSDKKTIFLDPWNYQFGIDFGKYGSGFDSIKINLIR